MERNEAINKYVKELLMDKEYLLKTYERMLIIREFDMWMHNKIA